MNTQTIRQKVLFLLRFGMGWVFFYAGISKILDPAWSAVGYLEHAQTFSNFFAWFATPTNIGWVNILNEWGLLLVGVALIIGVFVRLASFAGFILMLFYYFPVLNFPMAGDHSFIIDDHIIYMLVFIVLYAYRAGDFFGLQRYVGKKIGRL